LASSANFSGHFDIVRIRVGWMENPHGSHTRVFGLKVLKSRTERSLLFHVLHGICKDGVLRNIVVEQAFFGTNARQGLLRAGQPIENHVRVEVFRAEAACSQASNLRSHFRLEFSKAKLLVQGGRIPWQRAVRQTQAGRFSGTQQWTPPREIPFTGQGRMHSQGNAVGAGQEFRHHATPVRGGRDHSDIPDESSVHGIQNGAIGAGANAKIIGPCYDFQGLRFSRLHNDCSEPVPGK
jgi:hypothetical protein